MERAGIDEARLNAELLLADLLGTDRGGLFVRRREPIGRDLAERFEARVRVRETRVPLQHITGTQEFHGLVFRVDSSVLVPRPESEGLVDAALKLSLPPGARVADLGTGSGCLAIALAVSRPAFRVHALDRSTSALAMARRNAREHDVEGRIEFVSGDLAVPPGDWQGRMDLVVSNPPYVSEEEWRRLEPEVRDHEPREALVPGPSGLEALGRLLPAAFTLLGPAGWLLAEIGHRQSDAVEEMAHGAGYRDVGFRLDFQRIPRVLVARRPA